MRTQPSTQKLNSSSIDFRDRNPHTQGMNLTIKTAHQDSIITLDKPLCLLKATTQNVYLWELVPMERVLF